MLIRGSVNRRKFGRPGVGKLLLAWQPIVLFHSHLFINVFRTCHFEALKKNMFLEDF
jgi:hypothetical protein